MSSGKWFRVMITSRSDLAQARRYLPRLMCDEAQFDGVAVPDAKPEVRVLVGVDEIRLFLALATKSPQQYSQHLANYRGELVSEAVARHTDENPVCMVLALLPVTGPGSSPGRGPIQYVPVDGMPAT